VFDATPRLTCQKTHRREQPFIDTGRPKTATVGGTPRLRISSQALKRAWRTSPVFAEQLREHRGQRTQRFGEDIERHLRERGSTPARALEIARDIAQHFGKLKPERDPAPARTEQLAFIAPEERTAALALADRIAAGEEIKPTVEQLLRHADTAADIAMFGRMLADNPQYNREAAVQVAHAITTHRVTVEDDYYTAIYRAFSPGSRRPVPLIASPRQHPRERIPCKPFGACRGGSGSTSPRIPRTCREI
jgi:CRISPR system Cascade subunit CasC